MQRGGRKRATERERQTDRQTDRQETQTDRRRKRQTQADRSYTEIIVGGVELQRTLAVTLVSDLCDSIFSHWFID